MHINEGKGKLALFSTKECFTYPSPFSFLFSSSSTVLLISLLNFVFPLHNINLSPSPPHSQFLLFSLLDLHFSPPPQFYYFPSSTSSFILYIFPSTNTSTSYRPYIDPTSTLHRPHIDPTSTQHRPNIDPRLNFF